MRTFISIASLALIASTGCASTTSVVQGEPPATVASNHSVQTKSSNADCVFLMQVQADVQDDQDERFRHNGRIYKSVYCSNRQLSVEGAGQVKTFCGCDGEPIIACNGKIISVPATTTTFDCDKS